VSVKPYFLDRDGLLLVYIKVDKDDSTQSKKLDKMDLDDILSRVEDHETTQTDNSSVGAPLGGESFLAQFANVSDIKNDMSWKDIIPLEERQKLEFEEDERRLEETATNEWRKCSHAQVSYEGIDVDQPAPLSVKIPKAPVAQHKTVSQKAMELNHQRFEVIVCVGLQSVLSSVLIVTQVTESKLQDKNQGMLRKRFALEQ